MSRGAETARTKRWIRQRLAAAAGVANGPAQGRVFTDAGDDAATYPFIVITFLAPAGRGDVKAIGGAGRVMTDLLFIVKSCGPDMVQVLAIDEAVDAALDGASGTSAAGDLRVLSCSRERPFDLPEITAGRRIQQIGGVYRLQVQTV